MNELEQLKEWKERASAVLAELHDADNHFGDGVAAAYCGVADEVKLLLETAPLKYRRIY